jgi:hypothetical protein
MTETMVKMALEIFRAKAKMQEEYAGCGFPFEQSGQEAYESAARLMEEILCGYYGTVRQLHSDALVAAGMEVED